MAVAVTLELQLTVPPPLVVPEPDGAELVLMDQVQEVALKWAIRLRFAVAVKL